MDVSKSTAKMFVAKLFNAISLFAGITYFSRALGPSGIGQFFLFEMLVGLAAIVTDFGLRGAVEKRISERQYAPDIFATAIVLKGGLFIIVSVGLLAGSSRINTFVGEPVTWLLLVAIFTRESALLTIRVISGELRVGETAVLRAIQRFSWMSIGSILVYNGFGTKGIIYAYIIGFVAMFIIGVLRQQTEIGHPTIESSKTLLSYSRYYFVSQAGVYVYSWVDIALIGVYMTSDAVGAYEVAWRVTLLVTLLANSIALTIFPQISRWDASETKELIEDLLPNAITPALLLVIPSFVGTFLLSEQILRVVFGEGFSGAALVLVILMFQRIFQALQVVVGRALEGINKANFVARATIVTLVINFVLNIILIPWYGITGAAIATGSSFIINTLLHTMYLSRHLKISVFYNEVAWCIVSSIGMGTIVFILLQYITVETFLTLSMAIGVGAASYFLFLILNKNMRRKILRQTHHLLE